MIAILAEMEKGQRGRLDGIDSDSVSPECYRRFSQLGFREGCSIEITHHTAGGGVVVRVGSARYALDAHTARAMRLQV
ncbi:MULTISPECIES: FeoA family protein [Corynebacterium]|uniref:FeoA family protein n=1 Tax=Corynebacterium TaxID=1716 RepID=UPI00124CC3D5|nr:MULTISPECIES: FeoA family protein [Corynebacterium]